MKRPVGFHIPHDATKDDRLRALARSIEAGFDGVELAASAPTASEPDCAKSYFNRELTGAACDPPVLVVRASCPTAHWADAAAWAEDLLEQVTGLGASCLSLMLPPVVGGNDTHGFERYADAVGFVYRLLRTLRFAAESTGVTVAIEPATGGPGAALLSPVELRETIDQANSWAVGACVDLARLPSWASGNDWLRTLNRRVHCVRIDSGADDDGPRKEPPKPNLDVPALRAVLDEIAYEGPVIVVGDTDPALLRPEAQAHDAD